MNAIYPGSFDPVTNGHINIARRSSNVFERVIVAVLRSPNKTPLFSVDERVALLKEVFCEDKNIEVEAFSGLLADYANLKGINTIIRGLRNQDDFAKEQPYAIWNRQLSGDLTETLFLPAEPSLSHISGSIIREVAAHLYRGGHEDKILASMVPPTVLAALREKLID